MEDKFKWGASRNGKFSVKSAYHLLCNQQDRQVLAAPSTSSTTNHAVIPSLVWKRIWNCTTLSKIKQFLWRACAFGLATTGELHRQVVQVDPQCSRCGAADESITHILLECPFARATWFGSRLSYAVPTSANLSLVDWIMGWSSFQRQGRRVNRETSSFCSFLCWSLWSARNDFIFNRITQTPLEVIASAERQFQEYQNSLKLPDDHSFTIQPAQQWEPPPEPSVKISCDASFSQHSGLGGLGFIIRNTNGNLVLAMSLPAEFIDVQMGEALAIRAALLEASKARYQAVILESDSLMVIRQLQNGGSDGALNISPILFDILHLVFYFDTCTFVHIPRELNNIADSLFRRAMSLTRATVWPVSDP